MHNAEMMRHCKEWRGLAMPPNVEVKAAADQRTIETAVRTGYHRMRQWYIALKAEELGPIHAA